MLTGLQKKTIEVDDNDSRNIIAEGTFINGNLETSGNISMQGKMKGNIKSASKVVLGKTATMKGNIIATEVEVEGKLEGSIEAKERLLLNSNSQFKGDIHSKILKVEAGASMDGRCFINETLDT
ncbi:polymer-forming cytoskeletal protein [Fulvivirgaceae bacterium BMA10]|uniref:Polymer-forming cytoskeletal protein n=1 Tax=Splendidivirga corallicola TaxID=3051826 RepID=A0ABT8KT66_9BACT|nr:polymer-forming cytoskeletal protein [Fulvivirgaceae bacterium BMA10]